MLTFKRKSKTIENFWVGSVIAFQTANKEWQKGEITAIRNDSFYILPRIVRYHLYGTDTLYLPIEGYSVSNVYSLPKKGFEVDFKNGRFQAVPTNVHWYWIKNGWLFRKLGEGYAAVNLVNGLIDHDLSFSGYKIKFTVAASVFLLGVLLHKIYKPSLQLGRKYHLDYLKLGS